MTRRLAGELAIHLIAAVLLVGAPFFEPLRDSVGFELPARLLLVAILLGSAWVRRPSLQPPAALLQAAMLATATVQVILLVGTNRPGSVLWSLYLVSLWEGARHPRAGRMALTLACAVPWLSLFLFMRVHEGVLLAVPLTFTLFGPLLHLALRSRARRVRALERKTTELRVSTQRAQVEQARSQLLEDVERRLHGSLSRMQAEADALEQAIRAGENVTGERLTGLARAALHELRDAVWALDPSDGRWAAVAAHLRRVAADFGATSLEGELGPEETITAADRLALLRRLRALDRQLTGRAVRVRKKMNGLSLEIVDDAASLKESA